MTFLEERMKELDNYIEFLNDGKYHDIGMLQYERCVFVYKKEFLKEINEALEECGSKIQFGKYLSVTLVYSYTDQSVETALVGYNKDRQFGDYCLSVFDSLTKRDLVGGFPRTFGIDRKDILRNIDNKEHIRLEIGHEITNLKGHMSMLSEIAKDKNLIELLDKSVEAYINVYGSK